MKVIKINNKINEGLRIKKRKKELEEDSETGMLKFRMVYTVDGIRSEQTVSAVNIQKAEELIKKQYEGKNVVFTSKQQVNENLKEAYGYKISYDDLINIQGKIDRILRKMSENHQDEISPSSNTYRIGLPFIGTSEGYIDLQNINQYIEGHEDDWDDEDDYYESLKESYGLQEMSDLQHILDYVEDNVSYYQKGLDRKLDNTYFDSLYDDAKYVYDKIKDICYRVDKERFSALKNESLNEDLQEDTPSTPVTEEATGLSNLIITAINDEWKTIAYYNDLIQALKKEGFDDMIPVIKDIANEENKHVGQLQEMMKKLSPNTESISEGEQEGHEQMINNSNNISTNISSDSSNFNFKFPIMSTEGDYNAYPVDDDFGPNSGFDIYLV